MDSAGGPSSFPLDSDACELLMDFEDSGSLLLLAQRRHRDISVVSRQLAAVAVKMPVLHKERGRWRLTDLGRQMVQWARSAVVGQRTLIQQKSLLRLATTREFAARVLAPHLSQLLGAQAQHLIPVVKTDEQGVERLLLSGEADLGFDCGRPQSPAIRFRLVRREPLQVVAAPRLLKKHRVRNVDDLVQLPHLHYSRIGASRALRLTHEIRNIAAVMNDVASIRSACEAGMGWAVLPSYTVQDELRAKRLNAIAVATIESEQFGVFWERDHPLAIQWASRAASWLAQQDLG